MADVIYGGHWSGSRHALAAHDTITREEHLEIMVLATM